MQGMSRRRGHRRWMLVGLALGLLPLLGGCAQLNEWLEGTMGEEEETDEETPEEKLATQREALAGDDVAARKAAFAVLITLDLEPALPLVIQHVNDKDPDVAAAALSALQTVTGFAEKTEDERQLDPEGYERQLRDKLAVVENGLDELQAALRRDDDSVRYNALVVLYNLGKSPVVPEDSPEQTLEQVRQTLGPEFLRLAKDTKEQADIRLLAIENLVVHRAIEQLPQLAALLRDDDAALRGRAALALGQAVQRDRRRVQSTVDAPAELTGLARDADQPDDVRWRAALAAGELAAPDAAGLTDPFPDTPEEVGVAPLEPYRVYALDRSGTADAEVARINEHVDQLATTAEEEFVAEKKKGYR